MKEKRLQAARLAGIPAPMKLVTEPEAAALATLRDNAEDSSLKVISWMYHTLMEEISSVFTLLG